MKEWAVWATCCMCWHVWVFYSKTYRPVGSVAQEKVCPNCKLNRHEIKACREIHLSI